MMSGFYRRMAWMGIAKNRKLYLPYLGTCTGAVTLFYLMAGLQETPALRSHDTICLMLSLGTWVIAAFSVLFLMYSHSFLIRRRNKEFGLYNMLGMNKGNIGRILLWETLIVLGVSLTAGLALGVVLLKLAELVLSNIVRIDVSYDISVGWNAVRLAAIVFSAIQLLMLLTSLLRVRLTDPLRLMKSEAVGEKPPKANFLLAIAGIILLGIAYWLAITIEEPLTAMLWFFGAVLLVIAATYLLFMAGSVALCRLLQKNEAFYYRPNHFVAVSSMAYRMKRNGMGLASICILCTMVLVTMSSTTCLLIGVEDALKSRYPRDFQLTVHHADPDWRNGDNDARLLETVRKGTAGRERNELFFSKLELAGMLSDDGDLLFDPSAAERTDYAHLRNVVLLSLADYNALTGTAHEIGTADALVTTEGKPYTCDRFSVNGSHALRVQPAEALPFSLVPITAGIPTVYVILPDVNEYIHALRADFGEAFDLLGIETATVYAFDAEMTGREWMDMSHEVFETNGDLAMSMESRRANREDFLETYGSLFFVGILLSAAFLAAAMVIIYYKQVSEGYEDQARFGIMRKVGMTAEEIRSSIRSQVLMVFLPPLILAGVHTAFAFPMVFRILNLFSVRNLMLMVGVTAGCYLLFAVLYALVYGVTSRACAAIAGGAE